MQDKKYCRMLTGEHSSTLSTFIKLLSVIKIFVLSIFKWPLKTGFTVPFNNILLSAEIMQSAVAQFVKGLTRD